MSAETLALAVRDLAPAGTVLGEVTGEDPPLPWRSLTVRMPTPDLRSDAATALAGTVRVTATLAAASDQGVLRIGDEMALALEGAKPVVPGWVCGPLLHVGSSDPYLAEATVQDANRRLTVLHLNFIFSAIRLPEEP